MKRIQITDFISKYASSLKPGERLTSIPELETITGRITSPIRKISSNLLFFHIESDNGRIQVVADQGNYENEKIFQEEFQLSRGDIIQVSGFPGKTKAGEFSVISKKTNLLTKCLKDIPFGRGDGKYAVRDSNFLQKHREVGWIVGGQTSRDVFIQRSKIIHAIRTFLLNDGFLEVETPILWPSAGGAFAKPFQTTSKGLTLRISPELALKRLIVGGFDKVFEIGKVFRDEGISPRHNPEFTSIELYQSYSNADNLKIMTRNLLHFVYDSIHPLENGKGRITPDGIDFDVQFDSISVADELEKLNRFHFSDPSSMTPEAILPLLHSKSSLNDNELRSVPKLLDKLIGQEVESKINPKIPTYLCDHPVIISPLAKERPDRKGVTERFELFAGSFELCNAYSELNDSIEQRNRFQEQAKWRSLGDDECQVPDESFCESLEFGMPPTAGWGLGIDRFVMILLGKKTIRDVVLFPHTTTTF